MTDIIPKGVFLLRLYLNNYSFFCYLPGELRAYVHARKRTSGKLFLPYFNNIEITSIKIFAETTEISGKIKDLWYNRLFSVIGSTLIYDRILWDKKKREFEGTLFYNLRKVVK